MRVRLLTGIMITVLLLIAMACSTQNVGQLDDQHGTSSFDVSILPECFLDGSSAQDFTLETVDYGDDVLVNVNVTGAADLKALYFDMSYDAANYRPIVVDCGKLMGKKADLLCLQLFKEPGVVHYGQVMTNYNYRTGYTGDGTVASVLFKKMPAANTRNVSLVPENVANRMTLRWDAGTNTLDWYYYNIGDYNQSRNVAIDDLAPLGLYFGNSVLPDKYAEGTVLSVVDGNNSGNINIQDLSFIGINWGRSVAGGYNVYHSANADDYPEAASDLSAPAMLLANVSFGSAAGTAADRKRFSYVVAAPVADEYYWVRPSDGTIEGISSTLAGGPPATLTLTMTTAAESGSGTGADPYICLATTDYQFHLEHVTSGDVTATGVFTCDPTTAGTWGSGATNGLLNIDDAFTGTFTVTGTYNPGTGDIVATPVITIQVGNPGEDVEIYPDPADTDWTAASGTGTEADPYVLDAADLTRQYSLLADDLAGAGGNLIPVAELVWDAMPPFITYWATPGTFEANQFTSGYIVAERSGTPSNWLYAEIHDLP